MRMLLIMTAGIRSEEETELWKTVLHALGKASGFIEEV